MIGKRMVMVVSVVMAVIILFAAGSTPALAGIQDGKMSASKLRSVLGEYVIWHFTGHRWEVFDSKAPKRTNTLEMIFFSKEYLWAGQEGQWYLSKGSFFLWASAQYKIVENLTKQKFEEFDMSIDEIVQQASLELFKEKVQTVSVSSLAWPDYIRLARSMGGDENWNMFYYHKDLYFTNPPRKDRRTIVEAGIVYPKNTLEFLQAIRVLAHERRHIDKLFKDWNYPFLAVSFQEDVADVGAAAVVRYLQENYGMPRMYTYDYEKQYVYGFAERITPDGFDASSLAKFFKSLP